MQPEFAVAIDPLFDGALDLLERIEQRTTESPQTEHAALIQLFERVDALLGDSEQWRFARYAIAVWIDEMLLTTDWVGASWWRDHILEMALFKTRICNERFFELAREASRLTCRDALEVYYNCVLLGFRGIYNNPSVDRFGTDWPENIQQWLDRTAKMINISPAWQNHSVAYRSIQGAPPLAGKTEVVLWTVATLVFVLVNVTLYQFNHFLK